MTSIPRTASTTQSGIRPVNLRTDILPLADLIEVTFADRMDESGRASLREMRGYSRWGKGFGLIPRLNELILGISMGYVWEEAGHIVGNVSIYPARWHKDLGATYLIANVGVHPDYQRRGIATKLMLASMETIRQRGGKQVILQTDFDNLSAKMLYENLGFVTEQAFTTWKRGSMIPKPAPMPKSEVYITRPRNHDWRAEMALIEQVRPQDKGGVGWLRPIHRNLVHQTWWRQILSAFSMSKMERLIIRSEDGKAVLATLWIEEKFASSTHLTLFTHPDYQGLYDELLLNSILQRPTRSSMRIEHPHDDTLTHDLLEKYRFTPKRTVWHMRWDVE